MLSSQDIQKYCQPEEKEFVFKSDINFKKINNHLDLKDKKIFVESKHKILKEYYPELTFVYNLKQCDSVGFNEPHDIFDTIKGYKNGNKLVKYLMNYSYNYKDRQGFENKVDQYLATKGYSKLSLFEVVKDKYKKVINDKYFFEIDLLNRYYNDNEKLDYDKSTQDNICSLIKNRNYKLAYTLLNDMKYNVDNDFLFKLHYLFDRALYLDSDIIKIKKNIKNLLEQWRRK